MADASFGEEELVAGADLVLSGHQEALVFDV